MADTPSMWQQTLPSMNLDLRARRAEWALWLFSLAPMLLFVWCPGRAPVGAFHLEILSCIAAQEAPRKTLVPFIFKSSSSSSSSSSRARDVYDFYKPGMMSEYPMVDGKLSQSCYLEAVDSCYNGTMSKLAARAGRQDDPSFGARAAFDYLIFHAPYNKLVQQSLRRLLFNDAVRRARGGESPLEGPLSSVNEWAQAVASADPATAAAAYTASLSDKALDKALQKAEESLYNDMVKPGDWLSKNIGNSYTGSAHANLLALVSELGDGLVDKRVGLFSYGSGAIATMMALEGHATEGPFTLGGIRDKVQLRERLGGRSQATPEEFTAALAMREQTYGAMPHQPQGSLDHIEPNRYFLEAVNELGHRSYARKQ